MAYDENQTPADALTTPTRKFRFTAPTSNRRTWNSFLWPDIPDREAARKVAIQGCAGASLIIIVTSIIFIIARISLPTRLSPLGYAIFLLDVVPYGIIAFGISRMSRIAAVAGLVVYLGPRILLAAQGQVDPGRLCVSLALTSLFINGIRGTFAYHKLAPNATS